MRSLLTYIMMFVALLGIAGCTSHYDDVPTRPIHDYIKIGFALYGHTRGTIEDNECESFMSHLDVVIYKVTNDGRTYEGFYHERVDVSATPDGVASIKRTKQDFEEGITYKVYVIANSDVDPSIYYQSGDIISHDKFLKLDQTNRNIHLSGINFGNPDFDYPYMFLMDGVAYMGENEPAQGGGTIVINDGTSDDVMLKVTLRRAAAKIIVTIKTGDKVTFTPELMAQSQGYLLRNMPIRTTLTANGGYPNTDGISNPYWTSPTISQSPYFQLVDDGEGGNNVQITAYCYSHTWQSAEVFEKGTSLVVNLPMIYKESESSNPVEYIHNYYQISICQKEENGAHLIKRNTLYDLRVNLNAPGAEDYTTPEEIKDLEYFTTPWQEVTIPVSGENTVKYLKVNKNKLYMYHISDDTSSLYFSSSSPVTVQLVGSAYYYNKYNQKTTLSNNQVNISGSTEAGSTSGNISVHSDIPTNNTIRYFQLEVTNQEGMSEIIDVEQYPLIYITNKLPWYSYRDDYYYRTTGGHSWEGNVSKATTSGDSPTTYRYAGDHITSIATIRSVDTMTKTATYTYTSATPGSSKGWTASKVRGNAVKNSNNYSINYYNFKYEKVNWWSNQYQWNMYENTECERHNVRNYHVRVMATSGDYTVARPALDEHGYTADDEENSKLVSPSFVIASRLGAVLSTYSGLSGMSNEKKLVVFADHCKNYVEVDDVNDDKKDPAVVYDNWRLPTEAELNIIVELQGGANDNADAIDFLLNGHYYMSANGPVYNRKNNTGSNGAIQPALPNKWDASDVAIRCVRDAY